jgi:hypothetical protein
MPRLRRRWTVFVNAVPVCIAATHRHNPHINVVGWHLYQSEFYLVTKPRRPHLMSYVVAISEITVNIKKLLATPDLLQILLRYRGAGNVGSWPGPMIPAESTASDKWHSLKDGGVTLCVICGSQIVPIVSIAGVFPKLRTSGLMRHWCCPGSSEIGLSA